jgi:predicted aspartyl protease
MLLPLLGTILACSPATERVANYLFVSGAVNGVPVRLLVDTGASMNVLTPEAAARIGLPKGIEIRVQGTTDKTLPARFLQVNEWSVGSAVIKKEAVLVLNLPPELQVDGLVGSDTFKHFVTELDYAAGTVKFVDPTKFIAPRHWTVVPLGFNDGIPTMAASLGARHGMVTIDTGFNGTFVISSAYDDANHISSEHPEAAVLPGASDATGMLQNLIGRFRDFGFSGFHLPILFAAISKDKHHTDVMANVGAEVLRRFAVTLDYAGGKMYLRKSREFRSFCRVQRAGIQVEFENGAFIVKSVLPGSPAANAGILPDDEIIAIDNAAVTKLRALDVAAKLSNPAGTVVKIGIRSREGDRVVSLTLRDPV